MVETHSLTKRFGDLTAVRSLDLSVERGEVFGFLGPNGAGKSTTIRLLLDLIRPTEGSARLFGLDSRHDAQEIHRRTGLVPADVSLPGDLTGRGFLDYRDSLRGADTSTPQMELAERLGADLSRPISELSTGNRQKILLIQALAANPELLVLDEPTRGLDPLVQRAFHDILRERVSEGATVFLSSHSLAEVDQVADRVGVIRDGDLIAVEGLAALKAKATRTIELELASEVDVAEFAELDGVDEVSVSDNRVTARVRGSIDEFLRTALIESEVLSIRTTDAGLEDIFLRYYEEPVGS